MFDFSLSELILTVLVVVLFLKPQDVPVVLRAVAKGFGEVKRMAQELRSAVADAMRESGLEDVHKDIQANYIIDDAGQRQRVYDITDLMHHDERRKKTPE